MRDLNNLGHSFWDEIVFKWDQWSTAAAALGERSKRSLRHNSEEIIHEAITFTLQQLSESVSLNCLLPMSSCGGPVNSSPANFILVSLEKSIKQTASNDYQPH
ncbi:hypothetical protein RRG08_036723 [Elysia crispata]|uniref:Uncharacterized protein n=1 Tax=Elysia crispata TaxID=231223 RepID=A0AAE0XUF6_9GAST|nr:hypothetical protein RRG08_036723 [Elysia crispata]